MPGSHQPPPAGRALTGSTLPQKESKDGSPGRPLSDQRSPQAVASRGAGTGREEPPGRGSSDTAGPEGERRQDSPASASPSGGAHRRDPARSGPNWTREPALKGAPVPGAAEGPVAEAARQPPQSMSSRFWFWTKEAGSPSRSGSPSEGASLKALRNSSHPQSLEFLQAMERPFQIMADLLTENQQLQKEAVQVHSLQAEVKQLQKRQGSQRVPEHALLAENQRLRQVLQEMKATQEDLLAVLSSVQAENEALQQELQELRRGQVPQRETTAEKLPVPQIIAFPVQVWVSGETRGYEKQFLGDVAKVLVRHQVSLQVKEYQEDSKHLLVLFSPIALRAGTDIDNALNGFKSEQKILLVVLHHKAKNKPLVADKSQVQHPALVATVHAYYSMDDGFYHCQANEEAVASIVATVVQLTRES